MDGAKGGRIPLTVVGGFLGAGKTTLLNHALAQDRRAAVLVNDFGPVDVDAGLLADSAGQVLRLANGCCSPAGGLDEALARVLALDPLPEWIVIEASGVRPRAHRAGRAGRSDAAAEGVAVLVDAAAIREAAADPLLADTVARQLRAADLLVLNKTDLVSAQALDALRHWLHGQNGGTAMVEAREGRVGLECRKGTGTPMLAGAARAIRSTATRTRRRRIPRIPSIPGSGARRRCWTRAVSRIR